MVGGERRSSRVLVGLGELPRPFATPPDEASRAEPEPREPQRDPVAEAFERGRREGEEAARKSAEQALEARAEELRAETTAVLRRLVDLERELVEESGKHALELALEAASRIVRTRIESGDPVVVRALEEALDVLPPGDTFRIRLHPDDLEAVRRDLDAEIERRRLELVADESVRRGGCVVAGERATVDATIETATAAVAEAARGGTEPS